MNKLAIFDMDGLLVDSEPLQIKSYIKVFKKYGVEITKEEYVREWIQNGKSVRHYVEKYGLAKSKSKEEMTRQIRDEKLELYTKIVQEELVMKDGVTELLEELSGKMTAVIASSSRMESIELNTNKFDIGKYFHKLYSGSEHPRPKPHPDTFLEIANELGVKPSECIVLEDAEKGLIAAKKAGMKCIICPDELTKAGDFKAADLIVDSLKELNLEKLREL